jgi:ribosomal protein S18 acetylase RimI-like enzyme
MDHVEARLRDDGDDVARVLLVETSSTDQYERTRAFYRGRGYDEEATIREFYGPGDHKVVFWRSLVA